MGLGTWTTVEGVVYPSTTRYTGGYMWMVDNNASRDTDNVSTLRVKPYIKKKTSVSSTYAAYNLDWQTSYFELNDGNKKTFKTGFDFRKASVGTLYELEKASSGVFYTNASSAETVYTVTHDSSGNASVKLYGYIKGEASSSHFQYVTTNYTIVLPKINRPAGITALNANVGEDTTIFITRKDDTHLCTLTYSFGDLGGTIVEKTALSQVAWAIPTSFFRQLKNSASGQCTIICSTYSGDAVVGESTSTITVSVAQRPAFDVEISTDYEEDPNTMIDNFSNVTVSVNNVKQTEGADGDYTVTVSDGTISKSGDTVVFEKATEQNYKVIVTDARGLSTTKDVSVGNLIKYEKPAIGSISYERNLVSGELSLKFNGKWWGGSVGNKENSTVTITYSIYPSGSSNKYSDNIQYVNTEKIGYESFETEVKNVKINGEELSIDKSYVVEATVTDVIYTVSDASFYTTVIPPAVPLLEWGDGEFVINGNLTVKGSSDVKLTVLSEMQSDIAGIKEVLESFREQKILWSGAYYMHDEQTITLSEAVSEQPHGIVLVFSYYNSDLGGGQNESFSSHFVPKEMVARHPGCGHNFNLCGMWSNGMKYLYIGNTTIEGHEKNTGTRTIGGISHNNSYYVLRYVLGV